MATTVYQDLPSWGWVGKRDSFQYSKLAAFVVIVVLHVTGWEVDSSLVDEHSDRLMEGLE